MPFMACNRQVDSIDRRQCNLQTVPHEVERYARHLEELLLDMNHIKELPKVLFRLTKLKTLGLSDNDIYTLPADIAQLHSLMDLNLSRNDISDLPEEINACRQLMVLDLSSNPITRLPAPITELTSLTHLGLNDITLTQLPTDIGQLCNLRSLEVRENLIRSIPSSVAQLRHLQRFDLGQNELTSLPSEIGGLVSLQELYVDSNELTGLPEELLCCKNLEQLDVSENKLVSLPDSFGELSKLTDLSLSQNSLQFLPNSFGKLKKLVTLKIDRNSLTSLTPAIGSCTELVELFLTENLLSDIPSSIGHLTKMKTLNIDKNQLKSLPSTIGACNSLTVFSMRENLLEELPLEIGRLENLIVLDVSNNRLSYLPYTVNVLCKLQALWLSENQSQALMKLQTDIDPKTNMKVLTCYLLPQQSAPQSDANKLLASKSFLGGPKVHFGDDELPEEDHTSDIGKFERHNTPHPKPHNNVSKVKKMNNDNNLPQSDEVKVNGIGSKVQDSNSLPRSALKHPSTSSCNEAQSSTSLISASQGDRICSRFDVSDNQFDDSTQLDGKGNVSSVNGDNKLKKSDSHVSFGCGTIDNEELPHKIKRTKTPYYGKGYKPPHIGRSLDNLHTFKSPKPLNSDIPASSKSSDHIVSFNEETVDNENSLHKLKRTKTPHYSKTFKPIISTTASLESDNVEMDEQNKSLSKTSVSSQKSSPVVSFSESTINNEFTVQKLKRTKTPHYSKTFKPHISSQSFDDSKEDDEDIGVTFTIPSSSKSSVEVSFSNTAIDNENSEHSKIRRTKTPYYPKDFKPSVSSSSLDKKDDSKTGSRCVTFRPSISSQSSQGVMFDESVIDNEDLPHKLKRTKTPHYKKDHRPSLVTHSIDLDVTHRQDDEVASTNSSDHVVSFVEDTIDNENIQHKLKRTKTPHYSKDFKPSLVRKISNNDVGIEDEEELSHKSASQNSESPQSSEHLVSFDSSFVDNEDSPVKLKRVKTPHYSKTERPFSLRRDSHASSTTSDYGTHIKFADDTIDNSETESKLKRTKTPHYKKDHRPSLSSGGSSFIFSNDDEDEEVDEGDAKKTSCAVSFADHIPEETLSCKLKRINTPHYKKGIRLSSSKMSLSNDEIDNFDCPSDVSSTDDNKLCNTSLTNKNEVDLEMTEVDNDNNFNNSTIISSDIDLSPLNTTERSFVLKLSSKKRRVKFEDSCNNDNNKSDNCKLNRKNTPHSDLTTTQQQQNNNLMEIKRIRVRRDEKKSIGLTIAGGIECTPYKENDSGIFISKLTQDGPAMVAGLRIGDKIIRVNDIDVQNIRHDQFIECMKNAGDIFVLTIQRDNNTNFTPTPISSPLPEPPQSLSTSFIDSDNKKRELMNFIVTRDYSGSPGFAIVGGQGITKEEVIIVSSVTSGGPGDKVGLKVGDILLNINGTSVKGIRHDQAVTLLTGSPGQEVKITVLRDTCIIPPVITPVTSPIPPLCNSTSSLSMFSTNPLKTIVFGEPSWDGKIEDVELQRDSNKSLGLSIVGGVDQCSHPFGIEKRGVFISKITPNSPAAYCGKLRIGDRILSVNDKDIRNAKHKDAVDILKGSGPVIKMGILHEPQPSGLKEVYIKRRTTNESLGLVICGGTRSPQANPTDKTDEGIFVERVDPTSCAAECLSIQNGVRILEVNDDSILGCTQDEAASLLRNSGTHVRLLICDGFNKSTSITPKSPILNTNEVSSAINAPESAPEFGSEEILASSPNLNITLPATNNAPLSVDSHSTLNTTSDFTSTTPQPPAYDSHKFKSNIAFEDAVPLISSTPLPPAEDESKIPKIKIPPPVAPKPITLNHLSQSTTQNTSSNNEKKDEKSEGKSIDTQNAELLPFSSKIKKFESEISFASKNTPIKKDVHSKSSTSIPSKKPLITEDEIKKMKEEENKKMNYLTNQNDIPSPVIEGNFDQMISKIPIPVNGPTVVRTKKAETRLANATLNQGTNDVSPLTAIEQHALELKKRQEWRQARLKSIDNDMAKTEEMLNSFQRINSRVGNMSEDGSIPSTPIPRPLNDSSNKTEQ
uniref:Protein lap1 n=1 Tax=Strongyloides papillosus TaxID=174720 RepID=A0A0N5BLJ9_STREA